MWLKIPGFWLDTGFQLTRQQYLKNKLSLCVPPSKPLIFLCARPNEKQPEKMAVIISRRHRRFPREMTSEKRGHKFHTDDVSVPRSGQCFQSRPIRSTNQIWVVTLYQYETFLRSFLRRHFAGKPVVASRNDGSFLRLQMYACKILSFQ